MIMINRRSHEVFLLCEKCASTSIREALQGRGWERVQALPYKGPSGPWSHWDDTRFYGVCRNPYDRFLSFWSYWNDINQKTIAGTSFSQFMEDMQTDPRFEVYKSIVVWYQHFTLDKVFRFESLRDEFNQFFNIDLPHLNKSKHGEWKRYYNWNKLFEIANEFAGADFDHFDYEKMLQCEGR